MQHLQISLTDLGKRFHYDWIFRHLNLELETGQAYAVLGPNGSGKSTLLQVISGHLTSTEGKITYRNKQGLLEPDTWHQNLAIAAPYLELIEEFTLLELIAFHTKFKPLQAGLDAKALVALLGLEKSAHKFLQNFSSGMRQRVKLGLAFYTEAPVLLLDEPTSNLDASGIEWYRQQVQLQLANRLVIICSNSEPEYDFCQHKLQIQDFQHQKK